MNRPECKKIHEKIAESSPGAKNQGEFIYFFIPDSISRFPGPENPLKLPEPSPGAENQGILHSFSRRVRISHRFEPE